MIVVCDGGSRGNPGPAYGSVCINNVIHRFEYGVRTNNEAEYMTLINAMMLVHTTTNSDGRDSVEFQTDSELVVKQINLEYRVKDLKLIPLHRLASLIMTMHYHWSVVYVSREHIVEVLGH